MISSDIQIIQLQEVLFAKTLRHLEGANVAVEVVKDQKYTLIIIRMNDN